MSQRWRVALFASVLVTAFVIACLTPFAPGNGGGACGPNVGRLYRFVRDDISLWHGHWETFSLREVCRVHDRCYARPLAPRPDCDRALYDAIQGVCAGGAHRVDRAYCGMMARSYYLSVRWFGWLAYDWDDARDMNWSGCRNCTPDGLLSVRRVQVLG